MTSPDLDFKGLFFDTRASCFLDPVIHALGIACVNSLLDGSKEISPVIIYTGPDFFWMSFLEDLKVLSDSEDGLSLYACRAISLALMRRSSLAELEWYQSFCWDPSLFPKALSAAKRVAFFTFSNCSVEGRLKCPTKVEENMCLECGQMIRVLSLADINPCLSFWFGMIELLLMKLYAAVHKEVISVTVSTVNLIIFNVHCGTFGTRLRENGSILGLDKVVQT